MALELILNITANMLGAIAIILSTWAFMVSKRDAAYGDLDGIFYDSVLAVGIEKPRFRNPKYTSDYYKFFDDEDERIAYETYAFTCMGFCETVVDRASKDKAMQETWMPAVEVEYRLHKNWMNNPENHYKFKGKFRNLLNERFG
jgi:hypothetical protein